MSGWFKLSGCACVLGVVALVSLTGCNPAAKPPVADNKKPAHDHPKDGPHGGPIGEWGDDVYHVEFLVDAAKKQVIVYVLDDKAKGPPQGVDAAKITDVKVIIKEATPIMVDLKHDAKLSGDTGVAFTGAHEKFAKPDGMKVEISGKVNDKPYNTDKDVPYKAPKKTAQLYLTPGGIYTAADIAANDNTTPDVKLKGIRWLHAKDLKPGDKFCPVTEKKAQKECYWIVNGQKYEFCCPPCLDNFMEWAHFDTKQIKPANSYVFKEM